jgi:hypothetical protein
MATTVKVIKKNRQPETNVMVNSEIQITPEQGTRDVVRTIRSWVTEFQDRKRHQTRTLPDFPVVVVIN